MCIAVIAKQCSHKGGKSLQKALCIEYAVSVKCLIGSEDTQSSIFTFSLWPMAFPINAVTFAIAAQTACSGRCF